MTRDWKARLRRYRGPASERTKLYAKAPPWAANREAAGLAQAPPETRTASERMHRHQASGLAAALAAVVMLGVWRRRLERA